MLRIVLHFDYNGTVTEIYELIMKIYAPRRQYEIIVDETEEEVCFYEPPKVKRGQGTRELVAYLEDTGGGFGDDF